MSDGYIHVVGWDKFQHGKGREYPWIKDYIGQLHKDEYLSLSAHLRGILHDIRLIYAASHRQVRDNTATLHRQLGYRVMRRDIERLCDAGFITISASSVLAQSREEKSREEPPPVSPSTQPDAPSPAASTSTDLVHANSKPSPNGAQTLVAYFIDRSRLLGSDPPGRVKGQVARLVGELVAEGQTAERISAGLDLMLDKRLSPSTLPSCVQEAALPPPRRRTSFHVADRLLDDLQARQP